MHLKKCFVFIVGCFLLTVGFLYPSYSYAHSSGYKPIITIGNGFEVENTMLHYVKGQYVPLAISKAPDTYVINQTISFGALDSAYIWDFGDGTALVTGKEVKHAYKQPGSYVITIKQVAKHTLVDTLQIDILPSASYALPQSTILVNGQNIVQKFIHYINLPDKKSIRLEAQGTGVDIQKYQWEFSDGQTTKGKDIIYTYVGSSNSVVALLRITDANNLVHDEYVYLLFAGNPQQASSNNTIITSHRPANASSSISFSSIMAYYQKPVALIPFIAVIVMLCIFLISQKIKRTISQPMALPAFALRIQPYVRTLIYIGAIIWASFLYYWVATTIPTTASATATLMRYYGLTALFLLFIVLTPGLLRVYFPSWKYNSFCIYSRRAFGLSLFFFASLHGLIGWLYNLSGSIISILFLASRYQVALLCSSTAFAIFSLMALTSSDKALGLLGGKRWKLLHRCIYLAAILVLFHAFLIGSHFTNPSSWLPLVINTIALTYIFLELLATCMQLYRGSQTQMVKQLSYILLSGFALFGFFMSNYVLYKGPYNPHAQHGIQGSQQYEVKAAINSFPISVNTPTDITFNVYDQKKGTIVDSFDIIQEQLMHVIILNSDLNEYQHIHPTYVGNGKFTVQATFPIEGFYNLYIDYAPTGNGEITSIVPVQTTQAQKRSPSVQPGAYTKLFENKYKISLEPYKQIRSSESVDFTYTIVDAKTNKPVQDLQPYLGAFGHLAVVSEDGESFTHVHPIDVPSNILQLGGPKVRFNTTFQKPGLYKLFAQFKRNDTVFVTDFVIQVQ